ncbi:hypothetical protein L1I30_03280 [Gillisia sp. M10.2A]|uniref:Tetratricopeptide repeat protein n=1 Tax=Gillisia lutea TaxID=2909668 RepID=A0ABS9EGV0_9FLAO|nr:hypothetical protein [Gillisia lutea]MCF4100681.1 hypothetical protein [Gillisia lutea]
MKINLFCIILTILFSSAVMAQEGQHSLHEVSQDDLGNVSDEFQEYFFEALKQKAIENYEKAITALEVCKQLQPENAVIFFELGKNYKLLKQFDAAAHNLQQANRLDSNNQWIMAELLDIYYLNKQYAPAIIIAKRLIPFNLDYNDKLAALYLETRQYDELIILLDSLDSKWGINEYRTNLRQQIYALTNNTSAQIETLKTAIAASPENESNYLNLIFVYSEQGMIKEAFEAAEQMRKAFPSSKVVHLALYKFYLDSNKTGQAVNSMKLVLAAEEIDADSKFKVLNDFLQFVNTHPGYEDELKQVAAIFSEKENKPEIYQRFGEYYILRNEKEKAISYFEMGLEKDPANYDLLKNTLLLCLELNRISEVNKISKAALELYPAQPLLYLIRGAALNKMQSYEEAEEILTFGVDYIIEDVNMSIDFYEQLLLAGIGLKNDIKINEYKEKLNSFKQNKN